jgi:hypothetical protein
MILITCPLCNEAFFKSDVGVASHLRKHIREGLLAKEDYIALRAKLVNDSALFGSRARH